MACYWKFICFKHRHVSKRHGRCPTCQTELYSVGDAARIPKKNDTAGWKRFKEWILLTRNYDVDKNEHVGLLTRAERWKKEDADKIGKK